MLPVYVEDDAGSEGLGHRGVYKTSLVTLPPALYRTLCFPDFDVVWVPFSFLLHET